MARRAKEKITIVMRKRGSTLTPVDAYSDEVLQRFSDHVDLDVNISEARNKRIWNKYWAVLSRVAESTPFEEPRALSRFLRYHQGLFDTTKIMNGTEILEVRPLTDLTTEELERHYEDSVDYIVDVLMHGAVTREQVTREEFYRRQWE